MKYIGIIPARYASTRLPGKPLRHIGDKTIIHHVYDQVAPLLSDVVVATDDERILAEVQSFGGQAVMTSPNHRSGTDRCREALEISGLSADVVINIQGDEPFVSREHIEALQRCFERDETDIATPIIAFPKETPYREIADPNTVKVARTSEGRALYFSRSVIPHLRGIDPEAYASTRPIYRHLGLYAYRTEVLEAITRLTSSPLEQAESLEQLRWLEAGYYIRTTIVSSESIGIDTEEDLKRAIAYYEKCQQK